jgi:hypothetical protein
MKVNKEQVAWILKELTNLSGAAEVVAGVVYRELQEDLGPAGTLADDLEEMAKDCQDEELKDTLEKLVFGLSDILDTALFVVHDVQESIQKHVDARIKPAQEFFRSLATTYNQDVEET